MDSHEVKRKLTAILCADVKGYSRLMGEDEEYTFKTMSEYKEIMKGLVQHHRGRIVNSPGDFVLAEFASVVDLVRCAVEIQKELKNKNNDLPENRKIEFRIGINVGDVIEDGDQIYGDGVNIAARLEALADVGGICISENAYQQIANKLDLTCEYMGEHKVKNIANPVKAYRVQIGPKAPETRKAFWKRKLKSREFQRIAIGLPAGFVVAITAIVVWKLLLSPGAVLSLFEKPSIAVLPFTNMSGDKEQEYFADGLAEGIIDGLAKSDKLLVIARNSTFTYKGKPVKIKKVAEEMGVRYVLEGSVQKVGNRVRVTAQLIDSKTEHHMFSERYDRTMKDLLNLQDEIIMEILMAVQVKLTSGEAVRIHGKGTKNLGAYLKYMQARDLKSGTFDKERTIRSIHLIEEAIALDPGYSSAYSLLSTAYFDLVNLAASEHPKELLLKSVELSKKAIALDETNPNAHANLAWPLMNLGEFNKAIETAEKGISMAPNSAAAYLALGAALTKANRHSEAIPILKKTLSLSPVPIHHSIFSFLASAYWRLGNAEESIATLKKALEIYGPDHFFPHLALVMVYASIYREKEALAEGAEVMRIDPKFKIDNWLKGQPFDQQTKVLLADFMRKGGLK